MNRLFSTTLKSGKMSSFEKVSHVIFDMDGLLLDTEGIYNVSTQMILDPYGKTYTWEVKQTLMGFQSEEVAKAIVEIYDLPMTPEEYLCASGKLNCQLMKEANLLPDTEVIYEKIIHDIAKSFSKTYPLDVRMRILGTSEQRTAEIAVNDLKLPISIDEFTIRFSQLGRERLGYAPLLRGAERLLRHLHKNQVPICLATSSSEEMTKIKTTKHTELFSLFNHKVMGSSDPEVKNGKPAPDIFLIAANRFPDKPQPEKCLVFEDAVNGVKAARSANMQVVMVPDEKVAPELREAATLVLKSLEDFQPELFGLPAY